MLDDEHGERHKCKRKDELEAVDADDEAAGHELRDNAVDAHDERRHRDAEHEDHRHVEHPALAPCDFEEHGKRDEHERGEQLVRRAEERPDVHIASEAEPVGEYEREDGRDVFVHEEARRGARLLTRRWFEHLLQGHAADARDGVDRRHAERRDAHRDEAGGEACREPEDLREKGADAAREDLERRALRHDAVLRGRAGDDECDDAEQALAEHRSVADGQHVALVRDGLGGRAGRDEAVEAGDRAAGNRDEEDREERLAVHLEADERRHVDGRIRREHADNAAGHHAEEQERAQVVARLHEQPHRQDRRDEAIAEDDVAPRRHVEIERELHADGEHTRDEHDRYEEFQCAGGLHLADEDTERHRDDDVEHRDRRGLRARRVERAARREAVERLGNDVGERCDDEQRKEPAEKQEQAAARLTDVLLDEHAHRLALTLDRGVERREILYAAEKGTADEDPEQRRRPAEHRRDDRARHRTRARDG